MFNIKNVADEVFKTLRSYDYEVIPFDNEGMRVYEPTSATRFFTDRHNIIVTIEEDGENSELRVQFGKSVDINSIQGLINTLRTTSSKFGISFSVNKYDRNLNPKDFANGNILESYKKMEGSTKSSYLKLPNAKMIVRHNDSVDESKIGARGRNIKKIMIENKKEERFLMPTSNLKAGKAMLRHIDNDGSWSDTKGTMICELSKEQHSLKTVLEYIRDNKKIITEDVSDISSSCKNRIFEIRKIFEAVYSNYKIHKNHLEVITEDGDFDNTITEVMSKLNLEENSVIDRDTCRMVAKNLKEKKEPMVHLGLLGVDVEENAWNNFIDDNKPSLRLLKQPEYPKMGPSANPLAIKLNIIAALIMDDGLSVALTRVAEKLEDGDQSSIFKTLANRAIKIVSSSTLTEAKDDLVVLHAIGDVQVEKKAWEDFKKGILQIRKVPEFPQIGPSGDPMVIKLAEISNVCTYPGIGNMLSRVADDIDMGRIDNLRKQIATVAIRAVEKSSNNESEYGYQIQLKESGIIVNESVAEFAKWFDSTSINALFETESVIDFNIEDFLVMQGDKFGYGSSIKVINFPDMKDTLESYLKNMEIEENFDDLIESIISHLEEQGYDIENQDTSEDEVDTLNFDGDLIDQSLGSEIGIDEIDDPVLNESQEENNLNRMERKAKEGLVGHVVGNMRKGIAVVYEGQFKNRDHYAYYKDGNRVSRSEAIGLIDIEAVKDGLNEDEFVDKEQILSELDQTNIKNSFRGKATREGSDTVYTGEFVIMNNGKAWFHPDSGSAPFRTPAHDVIEENVLTSEDILLPNNKSDDLTNDIKGEDDKDEINRLVRLSGIRR